MNNNDNQLKISATTMQILPTSINESNCRTREMKVLFYTEFYPEFNFLYTHNYVLRVRFIVLIDHIQH
jgi:hypothetical protein